MSPRNNHTHQNSAGRRPGRGQLVRTVLWAEGLIVLCFGLTEALQRLFWPGLDMRVLHVEHLVRDIVCSLLVAIVVAWMILRNAPGFATAGVDQGEQLFDRPLRQEEHDRLCAQWFIALRWVTVMIASFLVFVAVRVAGWLPDEVWWPLVIVVSALALSNVAYGYSLNRRGIVRGTLVVQGYVDLLILVALLHFSGGIENPCSMLMIFHVMIAGMILSRQQCYWMALSASLMFGLLAWAEWSDVLEHCTLKLFPHVQVANGELFHPAHHSLYALSRVLLQALVMLLTSSLRSSERREIAGAPMPGRRKGARH